MANTGDKLRNNMASKGQIVPFKPNITEKSFYVHPKLQQDLDGIIATINGIENFGEEMGNRNFIFKGPPGTGKTLGVGYIATKTNSPVYDAKSISNPEEIGALYEQLRAQTQQSGQKALVLMDEIDRYSSRDSIIDPMQQQTLNRLLIEMDGTGSNNGIFVIGTTNRPNDLDIALRRPKRFSKEVEFMPPAKEGRLEILKIHANGKGGHKFKVKPEDLEELSKVTFGYTGADLVGVLNESFTHAILDNKRVEITNEDIKYALGVCKPTALKDMPFREPNKKFNDLGGYDDHKNLLRRIIENSNGAKMLFYGPPGTGKTEFGESLAGEYGFNYILVSGSEPEDKFIGETGKAIDKYLDRAKQLAPCIVLFDEIHALVENVGFQSHKSSWTGLLQSRLSRTIDGVYVLATTNDASNLPQTLRERFEHRIYFGMPSAEEQAEIWEKYLPEGMDSSELLLANPHLSPRDIANAQKLVVDYGLEPTLETYLAMIKDIKLSEDQRSGLDYAKIRATVGDSMDSYRRVQQYVRKEI